MKPALIATGAAVAVLVLGIGSVDESILRPPPRYAERRIKAIFSQAAQARFHIVLLGDSFVELADVPMICGSRPLNAGVSGAKAADTAALAERLLPAVRPQLVIVNVGVNDTYNGSLTDPRAFSLAIHRIGILAQKVGARVAFLRIAPLSGRGLATGFDAHHAAELDNELPNSLVMPKLATTDGLHPNASGYVLWKKIASGACPAR